MRSTARRLLSILAWGAVSALLAAPTGAALLPVSGTVAISIAMFPPVTLSGAGVGSSVGGGIASHPVLNSPGASVPIVPTFVGLALLTLGPPGSLPAGVGSGTNGLAGTIFFFGKLGIPAGSVLLTPVGGTGSAMFAVGPVAGTLVGATWQGAVDPSNPIVFSTMNSALAIPLTVTATAYDNRTADGFGTVQFVAPAIANIGIFGSVPAVGVLTLSYTPEPATILLLGGGIAGLAVLGRHKRSR